jgi:hypothetical protein
VYTLRKMRSLAALLVVTLSACAPGPGGPVSAVDADRAFVAELNEGDALSSADLLDDAITWTDGGGRTFSKADLSNMIPPPAIANETAAEAHAFDYGRVRVVRVDRDRNHALRVWVQRPAGWRLLLYQEVISLASARAAAPPGIDRECVNPCKSIPYKPETINERGVIAAYQALETAAHGADVDNWGRYVADEFVVVSSNSDRVLTKQARIDGLRKAAYGGVSPSPLVSTELFDFDNVVVMRALHKPESGQPLQIGRVWISRNGGWMSVLSYQTASPGAAERH